MYEKEINNDNQTFSLLKELTVSSKYILPYYYEQMNKKLNIPNEPISRNPSNDENIDNDNEQQEDHFMDYLLEIAERGEITKEFKDNYVNKETYTIVKVNPINKSFSYRFKSMIQQIWADEE